MDPAEWLKKYADRLDYVHFKDVDEKVYREVLGEHIRFFEGCGKGAMCPIGKGALDYPEIKQTLEDIQYSGYITVNRNVIQEIQTQASGREGQCYIFKKCRI